MALTPITLITGLSVPVIRSTETYDKNYIFNSLLVMRLINNEQFISELSKTNINALKHDYVNTDRAMLKGKKIVQMSDYNSKRALKSN